MNHITDEQFDQALIEIVEETSAETLLRIPRVYEVLSEHFNNEVIERAEKNNGWTQVVVDGNDPTALGIRYTYHDDYSGTPNEADFEHIKKLLREGYVEGELNTLDGDEDHRGWWKKL